MYIQCNLKYTISGCSGTSSFGKAHWAGYGFLRGWLIEPELQASYYELYYHCVHIKLEHEIIIGLLHKQ